VHGRAQSATNWPAPPPPWRSMRVAASSNSTARCERFYGATNRLRLSLLLLALDARHSGQELWHFQEVINDILDRVFAQHSRC